MPSSLHEIPLALLDERPALLLELVAAAGGPTIVADVVEPVRDTEGWVWQSEMARHWVGVGREAGREAGREEGARRALRMICEAVGVEWTDARAAVVDRADLAELDALLAAIARERR